jgi:peptide subunit release factor 1 (eRF1)
MATALSLNKMNNNHQSDIHLPGATELEVLKSLQTGEYFVTSLYLHVDGRRFSKKEYEIKLKSLIKVRKQEIHDLGLSMAAEASITKDFENLIEYVSHEFSNTNIKSIAAFGCSAFSFWKSFELPIAIHPRLVVSRQPYVRPLWAIRSENKRYFVIVINKDRAKLFERSMGILIERTQILDEIPHQTKETGWYGLEEKRIQRRIDDLVQRHFKHVSEASFNFVRNNNPDYLIIAGRKGILPDFERHLHSTLKEKTIARITLDTDASLADLRTILESTIEEFETEGRDRRLKGLLEEAASGGLAVLGLDPTLAALWKGQVSTLFFTEDFARPGFYCPECWFLSGADGRCPNDDAEMRPTHDVFEDAIETAIYQNCELVRIRDSVSLKEAEHMGALLRFRS